MLSEAEQIAEMEKMIVLSLACLMSLTPDWPARLDRIVAALRERASREPGVPG